MSETIQLGEIFIAVMRKDIKHAHLSVHPPDGRVTLDIPASGPRQIAALYQRVDVVDGASGG